MARNEEKARAMLNVFQRRHEVGRVIDKRPQHTHLVKTTQECEQWMRQVTREIIDEVAIIQNAAIGELKIREKNDLINKLIKERRFWELRIIELSGFEYAESLGIDCREERAKERYKKRQEQLDQEAILSGDISQYKKRQRLQQYKQQQQSEENNKNTKNESGQVNTTTKRLGIVGDFDSQDVIGVDGYYYFGAAKQLPGVRELYEKSKLQDIVKVQKKDLKQRATVSYFGFTEDYDHQLLREECEMERAMLKQLLDEYDALNQVDDKNAVVVSLDGAGDMGD